MTNYGGIIDVEVIFMLRIGTKEYYEAYAKISLIDIYNKKLISAKTIGKESPDIQDDLNNIGIEVTRSSSNAECMTDAITNNLFNKGYKLDELKSLINKKYKSFNGSIGQIDNFNYISPYKGLISTSTTIENIKNRIIEKSKLFYDHYKIYNENDLYVFTGNSTLNICDIQEVIDNLQNIKIPFDKIFINCIDKIFILNKNDIVQKNINTEALRNYKSEAINYKE